MIRNFYTYLFLFLFFFTPNILFSQFVASGTNLPTINPTTLVQNDLLGNGVTISNITTNIGMGASPRQFARFSNASSALPFSNGVMLCTGYADDFNNVGNTLAGFTSVGTGSCIAGGICGPSDSDLDAIITPNPSHDAAVLEFDFIPLSDTIKFRYVMASEEYPEYVCATFNDVFAFFLSGPGISGTQNIAVVPGSNPAMPVAINTINPGSPGLYASFPHTCVAPNGSLAFSSYYVDNSFSSTFQFDGLTTVLEAVAVVIPCSTYHIKLAISDAFDGQFDSAVFFEANSFSSNLLDVDMAQDLPDSTIVEACRVEPLVTLTLPGGAVSTPYPIPLNIFGTAVNGVDYLLLPDTVFVNPGDSTVSFNISIVDDGIQEGTETIFIEIENAICQKDTIKFVIIDGAPVNASAVVSSNFNGTDISCNSACDADILAIGGGGITTVTGDFTYQWDGSAGNLTTAGVSGLCPGTYEVIIFDDNFCSDTVSVSVTEPTIVNASITNVIDKTCTTDGQATASGSGGNGGYSYLWSTNAFNQTTATATGLTNGSYHVTVTDQNGCSDTITAIVGLISGTSVAINSSTNVSCNGGSNGSVDITSVGNGLTFLWSNGTFSEDLSNVVSGIYSITATDVNGCTATTTVTISEPSAIVTTIVNQSDPLCNGSFDGTAEVSSTGGTGSFTFLWSLTGQDSTVATGLPAGIFSVTATDSLGCSSVQNVVLSEPIALAVSTTVVEETCDSIDNGSISLNVTGGTLPYNYLWDTMAGSQTIAIVTGLSANTYTVTITDSNSCVLSSVTTLNGVIPIDSAMVPLAYGVDTLDCDSTPNGVLMIVPSSTSNYTYLWSNASTDASALNLSSGLYTVTITNSSGCSVTQAGSVVNPFIPYVDPMFLPSGLTTSTVDPNISEDIDGGNDESTAGVTYVWSSDNTDVIFDDINAHATSVFSAVSGSYILTLTATALSGCVDTGSLFLNIESPYIGIPDAFSPNGDGVNDLFGAIGLQEFQILNFKVFNRWSQVVFDSEKSGAHMWDGLCNGVEQPIDVYIYLIEFESGGEVQTLKGEVTLIR